MMMARRNARAALSPDSGPGRMILQGRADGDGSDRNER
jgi:hypothetical protein